jgi:hypothetical protein
MTQLAASRTLHNPIFAAVLAVDNSEQCAAADDVPFVAE